jgi:hypothetical protein
MLALTSEHDCYVVDRDGKVIQRGLTMQQAISLCITHSREGYNICRFLNGNLRLITWVAE